MKLSNILSSILAPKSLSVIAATLFIGECAISCTNAHASDNAQTSPEAQTFEADTLSAYQDIEDGFYFCSENVVETFDRNGKCYIVYDDPDEEFDDELLQVDAETYDLIRTAQSSMFGKLRGYLILNQVETEESQMEVYTYTHDPEEPAEEVKTSEGLAKLVTVQKNSL